MRHEDEVGMEGRRNEDRDFCDGDRDEQRGEHARDIHRMGRLAAVQSNPAFAVRIRWRQDAAMLATVRI